MKVLHLERKFTTPTETFIVNQINTTDNFKHVTFTIKHIKSLHVNSDVFAPKGYKNVINFKTLSSRHKIYFKNQFAIQKPKIIHSHFLTDARFFHSFTKKISVPKICSCYGYDVSKFPSKYGILAKLYFKKTFKEYDVFLAMTEDMKKDLIKLGCPERKILVHYHGINTIGFKIIRDYEINRKFVMLTIGSLVPKKGHLTVLKAVKMIKDKFPNLNFEYNIIGKCPLEKKLKEFVNDNMVDDLVHFKGALSHGEEFIEELNNAHVFVHPSITTTEGDKEGIPGTIVEAMASGLPVISTYHAGIPSVIDDGVTGFLVSENDSCQLADRIILLYQNEILRRNVGQKAKEYANANLDIHSKSKDLEAIYNSLIHIN